MSRAPRGDGLRDKGGGAGGAPEPPRATLEHMRKVGGDGGPTPGTQAVASSDGQARDGETHLPESCDKRRASPCPCCRDHHRRRRRAANTSPACPRER
ncbi:hypothetical protein NDU88_001116 [Pleurodeles waltl]|uniref:Uncharacterized protein n=1 Tax=Pleurodeles waltl TaxID=8319 RepID=A0AAV7U5Z3_PLEWA|nr:hypothetical protein NDU88_001116 [Pleurodeles waltl]